MGRNEAMLAWVIRTKQTWDASTGLEEGRRTDSCGVQLGRALGALAGGTGDGEQQGRGLDVEEAFHWRTAIRCFVSAQGVPRIEASPTHTRSQGRGLCTLH